MNVLIAIADRAAKLLFYGLILTAPACGGGGSGGDAPPGPPAPPPPSIGFVYEVPEERGDSWAVAHASTQGVDTEALEAMMDAVLAGEFDVIDSIAIARGGDLVFDETLRTTLADNDADVGNTVLALHAQFSVSKSITSLVVGIAIDEGHIAGVDVPYLGLFPYTAYANWDERKDDITLEHVLTMQLGLQWNESDPPYSSPDNQWNRFYFNEHDFAKALLDLPMAADPGTEFAYNTAATVSLGQAVENSVPLALDDFGISKLFLPLGITEIEVTRTPTGLANGGGGFYLRTRDAAKFGQLLLNDGSWNGERIVSSEWLAASVTPQTAIGWTNPDDWDWQVTGYGYQWWTGFYEQDAEVVDTWVAWGYGGQWVVAMPSLDLVVAVNSNGYDGGDAALNQAHRLIREHVLPALQ
jgi:CubicO group peptidase (beta-lactamase class C family)